MSCSQTRRTYVLLHWSISSFTYCLLSSSNSIDKSTTCSTSIASKVWKTPVMGRCNKDVTSSMVIVSSLMGRWKLLVFLCHLSAKADKSPLSPISNEHVIKKLNPIVVTMHLISGACLPNFSTFLP